MDIITIIIIILSCILFYFIYDLLSTNSKLIKKIEKNITDNLMELELTIDKKLNSITDNVNKIQKNQKQIMDTNKMNEQVIYNQIDNCQMDNCQNSPTCFIKKDDNKEAKMFYMSPMTKNSSVKSSNDSVYDNQDINNDINKLNNDFNNDINNFINNNINENLIHLLNHVNQMPINIVVMSNEEIMENEKVEEVEEIPRFENIDD